LLRFLVHLVGEKLHLLGIERWHYHSGASLVEEGAVLGLPEHVFKLCSRGQCGIETFALVVKKLYIGIKIDTVSRHSFVLLTQALQKLCVGMNPQMKFLVAYHEG